MKELIEHICDLFWFVIQFLFGIIIMTGGITLFVYHGILNAKHWFPSVMLFLLAVMSVYLFRISWKELREKF